jgi:hypothetical protein
MGSVREKIENWGKKNIDNPDVEYVLKYLRTKKKLDHRGIAKVFACSVPTIRYYLSKLSLINKKARFTERLNELGYKDLDDYFTSPKNTHRRLKELAKELGFCYPTVSKYYHAFRTEKEARTA